MAIITQIEIDGFKAFPKNFKLDLGTGKNLLLYGENGSGKSSLYYTLHALLQSVFKDDKGAKYFTPGSIINGNFTPENENLINIHRLDDAKRNINPPYIRITFTDGKIWRLDQSGLSSENGGNESEIRILNKDSAFINHSYISRFHSARNSEYIDLWNVFYKDILPFHVPAGTTRFLSDLYDEIKTDCKDNLSMRNKKLQDKIISFNALLGDSISKINTRINGIYNDNFRNDGDNNLDIKLLYYSDNDPDNKLKEHFYLYYGNIRNNRKRGKVELYSPRIRIEIKENGIIIRKPQSHFNEAKLTAIALAVRFSAMSTTAITSGSFLALDDMLISLDMSNRAKVVKYLIGVSDKYKIYMFTHDKAFYNYMRREIQLHSRSNEWVYKTISYKIESEEPTVIDEYSDYLSKAQHFYEVGDYDTSAIYLRKQLEQNVGDLLPYELKVRADGGFVELQTLWDKLVKLYSNNRKPIDPSMQKLFSDSKLLILNVAAHYQRVSNPIYKIELDKVFELVKYIQSLKRINNKLIIEKGKQIVFQHPTKDYKCSFELTLDLEIIQDEHIVAKIPKCTNIKWSYNGVENWDFDTNAQNNNHKLLTAHPRITDFLKRFPLGITPDMLMKHCRIEGTTPLIDYLGGIDMLKLSIKIDN